MKKRLIGLICTACLLLGMASPAALAADADTRLETIRVLGILSGNESGDLMLSSPVSRAEFAKMMAAASAYKDSVGKGYGVSLFADVKSGHWAGEYIKLAVEQGWFTGYVDGTFRPDNSITLEEGCTALLRLLGYDSGNLVGTFPDAQLAKAASGQRRPEGPLCGGVRRKRDAPIHRKRRHGVPGRLILQPVRGKAV